MKNAGILGLEGRAETKVANCREALKIALPNPPENIHVSRFFLSLIGHILNFLRLYIISPKMISTAEEFCRLRESKIPEEYRRAAHEEAPIEVWREIIATRPEMRSWVAHNKTVPLEILDQLSFDADAEVRCVVAGKRKINEAIALRLSKDPDEGVRHALIFNRKLPAGALIVLKSDSSEFVRRALHEKRG